MIEHQVNQDICDGCGKCVEICNLGLWEVVAGNNGTRVARTVKAAATSCHFCFFCKDICPNNAVTIRSEEDDVLGRIVG